jgi:hypothetical protein
MRSLLIQHPPLRHIKSWLFKKRWHVTNYWYRSALARARRASYGKPFVGSHHRVTDPDFSMQFLIP